MRRLVSVLTVAAMLVLAATLAWGFPGAWALAALPGAFLVGSATAHGIDAWMGRAELRLGVVVLGGTAGTLFAGAGLLFMAAASAPEAREVRATTDLAAPPAAVWEAVGQPALWSRWDALVGSLEAESPGRAAGPGAAFRSTLVLAGQMVPARHVVEAVTPETRLAWRVELAPGTNVEDLRVAVALAPHGSGTRATYAVSYRAPSTRARALDLAVMRRLFEGIGLESLRRLGAFVADEAPGG